MNVFNGVITNDEGTRHSFRVHGNTVKASTSVP